MAEETRSDGWLRKIFKIGVLLTLVIAPTQWAIEYRPKSYLSPADLTLALTALVWFLDNLIRRDFRRMLRIPHWSHLAFIAFAAISIYEAEDVSLAVKDLVQYVEYFLVGTMMFDAFLRDGGKSARNWALSLSGVVFLAITITALVQYNMSSDTPLTVRGTFGNRNVLGGYMALALPMLFAGILAAKSWLVRVPLIIIALLAFGVVLSGAAYWAIFFTVLALALRGGWKVFLPTAVTLIYIQVWVLPELPRVNDLAHFYSVSLVDEEGEFDRRYPDWQAAYNMALSKPDMGVGLGNYQKNIGKYYDKVPRRTGPSEPDTQNLYLVLLASCGLTALVSYLAIISSAVGCAGQAACRPALSPTAPVTYEKEDPITGVIQHKRSILAQTDWIAAGTAASLLAFAGTCIWHPLLVRGIGIPFVFMLSLAHSFRNDADA